MAAIDKISVDEEEGLHYVETGRETLIKQSNLHALHKDSPDGNDIGSVLQGEIVDLFKGQFRTVKELLVVC